jgi:hypothetical protein
MHALMASFNRVKKRLPSLQHLNLLQCPVAKKDAHRDAVFDMLPSLFSLDFKDRQGFKLCNGKE